MYACRGGRQRGDAAGAFACLQRRHSCQLGKAGRSTDCHVCVQATGQAASCARAWELMQRLFSATWCCTRPPGRLQQSGPYRSSGCSRWRQDYRESHGGPAFKPFVAGLLLLLPGARSAPAQPLDQMTTFPPGGWGATARALPLCTHSRESSLHSAWPAAQTKLHPARRASLQNQEACMPKAAAIKPDAWAPVAHGLQRSSSSRP